MTLGHQWRGAFPPVIAIDLFGTAVHERETAGKSVIYLYAMQSENRLNV
jgi:hypothetical protein